MKSAALVSIAFFVLVGWAFTIWLFRPSKIRELTDEKK